MLIIKNPTMCVEKKWVKVLLLILSTNGFLIGFMLGIYSNNDTDVIISLSILFLSFIIFMVVSINERREGGQGQGQGQGRGYGQALRNSNDIETVKELFDFSDYKKYNHKPTTSALTDGINCSICLELLNIEDISYNKYFRFKCDHIFHDNCLKLWVKENRNCPNCRGTYP
jgi:hypothetical protein